MMTHEEWTRRHQTMQRARIRTLEEIAALEAYVAAAGMLDAPDAGDVARMHGLGVAVGTGTGTGTLDAVVGHYTEVSEVSRCA